MNVLVVRATECEHERLAQAGQVRDAQVFVQAIQALERGLHHGHPGDQLLRIVLTGLVVVEGVDDLGVQVRTKVVGLSFEELVEDLDAEGGYQLNIKY